MLTYASWAAVPGLAHGFLGRDACAGAAGWDAVVARAGFPLPVVTARQVHGTRVETAAPGPTREADGLITATAGQMVGVVTADCMPVLLIDRQRRVAAAVHAGWRGAAAGLGPCRAGGSGYCSYRRDGAGAGRQLSFVGWASPSDA